jgi:tetratricopeptide (TPR) repeat protein
MHRKELSLFFAGLLFVGANGAAQDQDMSRHVYLVSCSGNPYHAGRTIQTGFRMKGTKGIITSLHGVLGATSIAAQNDKRDVLVGLTIYAVDIDNDLALLISRELQERSDDGLVSDGNVPVTRTEKLMVLGHPSGIELYEKTVNAGNPTFKKLSTLIPPSSGKAFEKRKSPYEGVNVLNIEGNLVGGDSGAPVLDSNNRVVAVVDGGLLGGIAAISWAIPIQSVVWSNASDSRFRLNELASLDSTSLFSYTAEIDSLDLPNAAAAMEAARLFDQGAGFLKLRRWAEASESFRKAIERDPRNADFYYWLGNSLFYEGKWPESENAFRAALGKNADNAKYHEMLAYALYSQRKFKEAEASFLDSLHRAPGNGVLYCWLGYALYWQEKFAEAIEAFKTAIGLENGDIECLHFLGHCYLGLNNWKEAEAIFKKAIKMDPNKAEFRDHLGDAFAGQARWKDAEAAYRDAFKLEPSNHNYDEKAKQMASQRK